MPHKQKNKFKILFYPASILALFIMAIIIVPPMIHLNFLKPKIENIILSKTGEQVKINGDITISLLGKATIVAHDISVPNGVVSSCEFTVPLFDIFNIKNAQISDDIIVNKASLLITKIVPFETNAKIIVKDSKIQFLNKEYKIINANLSKNTVNAVVRTDQHKYDISAKDGFFVIKNKNNNLKMSGELFKDGTATANINIIAQDVNRWFEFEKPRITGKFPISAELKWNGSYGIDFYNISANGVSGSMQFQEDGYKIINLESKKADYDLSFLATDSELFQESTLDLDFYGKLKFFDKEFKHVKINSIGHAKKIEIKNIIADDLNIQGGFIDENGAHNVNVSLLENGINTTCLFDGTPNKWKCEQFSYGDTIYGSLSVTKENFYADIKSNKIINDLTTIVKSSKRFGSNGIIDFDFPDMSGKIIINKDKYNIEYKRLNNKTLEYANIKLPFIPEIMQKEKGDFTWDKDYFVFVPESKTWQLSMDKDLFTITGDNFKQWFQDINLESLKNLPYTISGNYKHGNISNFKIQIAQHSFNGSASQKSITLKTDLLNIDDFIDENFKENYEELSFFTRAPITIPFDLDTNVALSANSMIYNNQKYNNFVYSLHKNIQTFSISDSKRGNLLATLKKDNIKYDANIQLNKFTFDEKLLPNNMPLNISNTVVTAEIKLKTYGKIAHDIINNLNGTFDASFDGGILYGIGTDGFYASAKNITTLSAEEALTYALTGGESVIKKMRIIGTYDQGDIKTTTPLTLSLKHVDSSGILEIKDKKMYTQLKLLLRGTSTGPEPINLIIQPNNSRDFSLSEIMLHFDPEYMRTFTQTHNQF
jgi:hypothetical protein